MGQEAQCICRWNDTAADVKAVLEPPELILRGGIRQRLPYARMEGVRADGDQLRFRFNGDAVALALGARQAEKWARAILAPPPSLASKLGIDAASVVRTIGNMDADELDEALAAAKAVSDLHATVIVARVDTPKEVHEALRSAAPLLAAGVPIWFVYPKGRGQGVSESDIRTIALATGIVDTKVARISAALTGLRFVKRREG